jgi:MYXO-CTERM domain-containing protein
MLLFVPDELVPAGSLLSLSSAPQGCAVSRRGRVAPWALLLLGAGLVLARRRR